MKNFNFLRRLFVGVFLMLWLAVSHAQLNENAADCNELKDPDVQFQMDLCKAHVGCRLVMGIHSTCVKAKKFFNNIKEQVGEGVKGLFGYRKEVTSDMVFEASLDDKQRTVTQDKEWKDKVDALKEEQKKAGKEVLTGASTTGGTWTYIGDVQDGKKNGKGTTFYSDGQIERGEFKDNARNGAIDMIQANGGRSTGPYLNNQMNGEGYRLYEGGSKYKGGFSNNSRNGEGVLQYANGQRYEGSFKQGDYSGEGIIYYPNGNVMQRGVFDKNELSVGKKYDGLGNVVAQINKPLDEQKAWETKQQAEAEKQRQAAAEKQAAEQRQRDAKAAADKAYRDSLAQMNAGQLFAKADELQSAGDSAKAREVLRTLVSRFPDHPLAANAANQLSNLAQSGGSQVANNNNSNTNSGGARNTNTASNISGRPFQECADADKNNTSLIAKMNAIPKNDTVKLIRGAHFASRWMVENYSRCLPDSRAKEAVDQFRKTMAETMTTCKQLSSNQSICEVSPL